MTQKNAAVLSVSEFMRKFPDEQAALDYITRILWPDGPVCPFCGSRNHRTRYDQVSLFCADCRRSYRVRTNTIFHHSHIPLNKWLYAMHLAEAAGKAVSSTKLSREIGITQKSAWLMLQRIHDGLLSADYGAQIRMILSGMAGVG